MFWWFYWSFFAILWVSLLWFNVCTHKMIRQRRGILNTCNMMAQHAIATNKYDYDKDYFAPLKVSSFLHVWYLMTFRDYRVLYTKCQEHLSILSGGPKN